MEDSQSGSVRHPVVLGTGQSEANIPILGYVVIGQILTGDPHFRNTMFRLCLVLLVLLHETSFLR